MMLSLSRELVFLILQFLDEKFKETVHTISYSCSELLKYLGSCHFLERTAGLTSFPDYLVLHMRKFVMDAGWVPRKLDVYVDVPDIIDISHMRSKGLHPGEELLPESAPDDEMESEELSAPFYSTNTNSLHDKLEYLREKMQQLKPWCCIFFLCHFKFGIEQVKKDFKALVLLFTVAQTFVFLCMM